MKADATVPSPLRLVYPRVVLGFHYVIHRTNDMPAARPCSMSCSVPAPVYWHMFTGDPESKPLIRQAKCPGLSF